MVKPSPPCTRYPPLTSVPYLCARIIVGLDIFIVGHPCSSLRRAWDSRHRGRGWEQRGGEDVEEAAEARWRKHTLR